MKFRFIDEIDINGVQGHTNLFDTDQYIGLMVRIVADNTAGTNISEANAPRIRLNFRGDDIVNSSWASLRAFADLEYGHPENAAAAATWQGGIYIPFYHPDLPNAIEKRQGDNMDFYSAAFGVACKVSCVMQIYGVIDDLTELYVPKLIEYTDTAAAGQHKIFIDQDNIAQIVIFKPATTEQELIQLFVDNELIYSGDWHNLENFANLIARIEAAALDVVVLDLVVKGQISEALSDEAVLLSTGGVGAYNYLVQSLTFNPAQTVRTSERVIANANFALQRKINRGKISGATVSAMKDLSANTETMKRLQARPEFASVKPAIVSEEMRRSTTTVD